MSCFLAECLVVKIQPATTRIQGLLTIKAAEAFPLYRWTPVSTCKASGLASGSSTAREVWNSTGQEIFYAFWGKGVPDNEKNNEHCLQMMSSRNHGRWNDLTCDGLSWSEQFTFCENVGC